MRREKLLEQWRQTSHLGAWIQNQWRGDAPPVSPDELNLVLLNEQALSDEDQPMIGVSFEALELAIFGDVL